VTRQTSLRYLVEIAKTIVLTVAIFLVIHTFVAQPFEIRQHSMETTLLPDQYVLVDKLTPRFSPYARGDIVVFRPPDGFAREPNTPFIKRVIGLAGDIVEFRDGHAVVNGTELVEPYVFEVDGQAQPTVDPSEHGPWTVPDGGLFLMGDHRAQSEDSRVFGPVSTDLVIGRAWLRYWPLASFSTIGGARYDDLGGAAP
jgi:signal peptidase I